MSSNDQDFVIHITVEVDAPKPYDVFAMIAPVSTSLVKNVPATELLKSDEIESIINGVFERRAIEEILGWDWLEYRRALRRKENVPPIPDRSIAGFALVSRPHIEHHRDAYPYLADFVGMEATDAN